MSLSKIIGNINPEKVKNLAVRYKSYVKFSSGIGGISGFTLSCAHMLDLKNDKHILSNKEKIIYPIVGTVGGAFVGVSCPIWIIFAPVTYLFDSDITGSIAKLFLFVILSFDDGKK